MRWKKHEKGGSYSARIGYYMGMNTTHQTVDTETGCLRIVCGHCGHKQGVEPAVSDEGGWIYGSGADFCEECDRAFQEREEDRILVRVER